MSRKEPYSVEYRPVNTRSSGRKMLLRHQECPRTVSLVYVDCAQKRVRSSGSVSVRQDLGENPREFPMMNNHAVRYFSFLVLSLIVKDGAPGPHTPPVERRG
jgi:hypothetical protein